MIRGHEIKEVIIDDPAVEALALIDAASKFTSDALKEIIEAAKAGDQKALNKLKAFSLFDDPQLAARVATMNRETRRAFLASRRKRSK